jgi:hypothetical protein
MGLAKQPLQLSDPCLIIGITKDISGYSPYNVPMHKTAGKSKVRQVQAPESKIEVKQIDARRRMPATSRIPVSKTVWAELSELKKPGETFDHLLAEMIEREKKNRFFEDMDRIEKRGKFVAMEW